MFPLYSTRRKSGLKNHPPAKDTEMPSTGTPRFVGFEQETLPQKSVLYQAAYSILGSRGDAEDAVQETYFQAWKSYSSFEPGTNCRAWMFSILFNVIRHQRRKWIFRMCLTDDATVFEKIVPAAPAMTEELSDPAILAAFRKLPQPYQEAVLLADVHEFSYKEISDVIGRPIGTVMSRISRGRQLLRKSLAPVAGQYGILRTRTVTA
jgi:RNA polymerase sigma-70 factor (ECF subfamily)